MYFVYCEGGGGKVKERDDPPPPFFSETLGFEVLDVQIFVE